MDSSLLRYEWLELEFSDEFATWCIVHNFENDYTLDFLCNGWEL